VITITLDIASATKMMQGIERGLNDLSPVWKNVDVVFRAFMRQVFQAEGAYGGPKWRALNTAYAEKKKARWGAKPILQASGALMRSFTAPSDPNHVYRVGPTFGEFGSRVRYAKAHQYGVLPHLPARPIVRKFTKAEGEKVVDIILKHLLREARR